jgi:hypothetical protein
LGGKFGIVPTPKLNKNYPQVTCVVVKKRHKKITTGCQCNVRPQVTRLGHRPELKKKLVVKKGMAGNLKI